MRTKDPWTRPRGRPPTDAEEFVLRLARKGNEDAQSHVYGSPYLRDQARWACAIEALNAIGRVQRPDETIGEAGERLAKQALSRSCCWGLRDGEWWLVEHLNGEPQTAYHQLHGRTDATMGSFEQWRAAGLPCPVVAPASTPANVAVSMCASLLLAEKSTDNAYGLAFRDGVEALAADLTTPEGAKTSSVVELQGSERDYPGELLVLTAANDLHRQQVAGANRREARLRSQLEAWRERSEARESEMLEQDTARCSLNAEALELRARAEAAEAKVLEQADAPRDVLEAAHELRQLGCEGEDAHAVMVDAARLIGELATVGEALRVDAQRKAGAFDRIRHRIALGIVEEFAREA